MLLPLFLFTRNGLHLELPETLEGCNATVAGWGSFHDTKCTTDERSPSQNERCVFPFEENIGSSNQQKKKIKYNSCTYAANPSTKNPFCKDFYQHVHVLKPSPNFPIILDIGNETIVCQNNTHGKFGWCRTSKDSGTEEDGSGSSYHSEENKNWGWCRQHCHKTNVMKRSRSKVKTNHGGEKFKNLRYSVSKPNFVIFNQFFNIDKVCL